MLDVCLIVLGALVMLLGVGALLTFLKYAVLGDNS